MASVLKVDTIKSPAGNEAITISESGVPQLNVPAFLAYRNGNKSVGNAVWDKADFNAVAFDTNNWYDTNTYRYVPQIAGYYHLNSSVYMRASASMNQVACGIAKNGTSSIGLFGSYSASGAATGGSANVSGIIYLNGSTDYVEGVIYGNGTSPYLDGSGTLPLGTVATTYVSYITGFLVRAA